MALSSMPNEMIEEIFRSLHIEDIDAFAFTSKSIRAAAGRPFIKHQELKKAYSQIVFEGPGSTADGSVIKMLDLIVQMPDLRFYPRSIAIRRLKLSSVGLSEGQYTISTQEREILQRNDSFRSLWDVWLRLHPEGNGARLEHSRSFRLFKENPNMLALLLAVLPNLRKLQTRAWERHLRYCSRLVAVDADPVDRRIYMAGAPSKLEEIIFTQTCSARELELSSNFLGWLTDLPASELQSIENLLEWSSLPSVRRIRGDLVQGVPGLNVYWNTYQLKNIEEISLANSSIDTEKILWMLAKTAVLKVFKYEFRHYLRDQIIFEPHLICQGLVTHASRTLEHLVLMPEQNASCPERYERPIDSLRGFQCLRVVEFDSAFLKIPRSALRLVDILPASIETVCFRVWQVRTVRNSLAGMEELRSSQLPKLQDLVFHVDRCPVEETVRQTCRNCDLNLIEKWDGRKKGSNTDQDQ